MRGESDGAKGWPIGVMRDYGGGGSAWSWGRCVVPAPLRAMTEGRSVG